MSAWARAWACLRYDVAQCAGTELQATADSEEYCNLSASGAVRTIRDGTSTTQFAFSTFVNSGSRLERDCAEDTCLLAAVSAPEDKVDAVAEIAWAEAPSLPPVPRVAVEVDRDNGGANEAVAVVVGRGFTPGQPVSLVQCPDAQGTIRRRCRGLPIRTRCECLRRRERRVPDQHDRLC